MGLNGPYSELIYHDGMINEGWISSWFILVHKRLRKVHKEYEHVV